MTFPKSDPPGHLPWRLWIACGRLATSRCAPWADPLSSYLPPGKPSKLKAAGEIWAIPWSIYTFVIFYRRDLLQRAGVEESTAFSTLETMRETMRALQNSGIHPWTIPTSANYLDLPHIVSCWARAYGGDFFAPDGKRPYFNTPHARKGLLEFFELCRFIPTELQEQNYEAGLDDFFHKEKTAVLIAGAEAYSEAQQSNALSESIRDHIGVAAIPGVSWIGGDHLVIWKTVRFDPRKEHAALDLIQSLTSVENQIRLSPRNDDFARGAGCLRRAGIPTRGHETSTGKNPSNCSPTPSGVSVEAHRVHACRYAVRYCPHCYELSKPERG